VTPLVDKPMWQQQFAIYVLASYGIGLISKFSHTYVLPCVYVA